MADVGDDWGGSPAAGTEEKADSKSASSSPATAQSSPPKVEGRLDGNCIHCKVAMGHFLGTMTPEGPIHNECIPAYKRTLVERCAHCDCVLKTTRTILNGKKLHPECVADFKAKKPYIPPSKSGVLQKFAIGRSFFGSKNWKERYFVLSQKSGFAYYENEDAFKNGKPPKGVVPFSPQCRLITNPSRLIHKEAANPSTDMIIVFFEQGTERRLLTSAKTWQEHDEWTRCLESYIKVVNDPRDLVD